MEDDGGHPVDSFDAHRCGPSHLPFLEGSYPTFVGSLPYFCRVPTLTLWGTYPNFVGYPP